MKKLSLFLVLALGLTGCLGGEDVSTDDGGSDVAVVDQSALDCDEGWTVYEWTDTGMQFCYGENWGTPVVTDIDTVEGTLKMLSFEEAGSQAAPTIWVESSDFVGLGGDVSYVDFGALSMTASEDDLMAQFKEQLIVPENGIASLRKDDVGGVRALRLHIGYQDDLGGGYLDEVRYYVPSAFEGHNVTISADNSLAEEIDLMVWNMRF